MSLTPEQLAAENAFFDAMYKAVQAFDAAATFGHLKGEYNSLCRGSRCFGRLTVLTRRRGHVHE